MDMHNLKKLLKSYKEHMERLKYIKEKHETLKERLISPQAQVITDMPRGSECNKNKILDGISNLEELDSRAEKQQKEVLKVIYKIEDCISNVKCQRAKTVLELRYFKFLSWEVIGRKMYCDKRTAQRIHGQALKELANKK